MVISKQITLQFCNFTPHTDYPGLLGLHSWVLPFSPFGIHGFEALGQL